MEWELLLSITWYEVLTVFSTDCVGICGVMQDRGKIPADCEDIASLLLPPDQVREREELIAQGFPGWTRSHFYSFIDGMAVYGRDRLVLVAPFVSDGRVVCYVGLPRWECGALVGRC